MLLQFYYKFTRFNIEYELYEISSKREPIKKIVWIYLCSAHQDTTDYGRFKSVIILLLTSVIRNFKDIESPRGMG